MSVGGGAWPFNLGGNEMHEWNGTTWIALAGLPRSSSRHAVAFDSVRNTTLLFGGSTDNQGRMQLLADTWTWDGSNLTQLTPLASPQARAGHGMAFDAARGRTVLFGGSNLRIAGGIAASPPAIVHGDTWEWDGTLWVERSISGATPPARRWLCAMAYDKARDKLVLFGGLNDAYATFMANQGAPFLRDTWEDTPGVPGSFATFGRGCAGSRGVPTLAAWQGRTPVSGQSFRTQVSNLPLSGPAFLFVGASNVSYGGLTLPFDLGGIGMAKCWLNVGADVVLPVTNVLGMALSDLEIPAGLAGSFLYEQAVVVDPSANLLGLVTSKGAELEIGGWSATLLSANGRTGLTASAGTRAAPRRSRSNPERARCRG